MPHLDRLLSLSATNQGNADAIRSIRVTLANQNFVHQMSAIKKIGSLYAIRFFS
jgi:hypothetical protein